MEKNYISLENSRSVSMEDALKTTSVPKSFIKIMVKFGLVPAVAIVINRLRYRVRLRIRYNLALLRTLQVNYSRLKASKVTLWMLRKSITSRFWSGLIAKIEMYFNKDYSVNFTKTRNSDSKKLFKSLYQQSKI